MLEKKYNSNDFKRRIQIKKVIKSKNNFAEYNYSYSNFITTYAKIERTSSDTDNTEKQNNNKMLNRYTLKITIRYISNLSNEMFIYYNKTYYRIANINDLYERHRFIELTCEKIED